MTEQKMSPLGWYVRVTTNDRVGNEPVTILYLVGYPNSRDAEEAVKKSRSVAGEDYRAVAEVISGRGPQPKPNEVRELKGAV